MRRDRDLSDLRSRQPEDLGPLFQAQEPPLKAEETRREAYKRVQPALPEMEARILEVLKGHKDLTNMELTYELGFPGAVNRVTRQVFNLREAKKVVESCKRKDRYTGMNVTAWRAL